MNLSGKTNDRTALRDSIAARRHERGLSSRALNMPVWSRSKRIAWVGLAAMWMLLCAPLISQYLRAHPSSIDDALSSTFCTSLDETATQGRHTPITHATSAACGYCSLLAHTPPLPSSPITLADIRIGGPRLPLAPALPHSGTPQRFTPPSRAPPHA